MAAAALRELQQKLDELGAMNDRAEPRAGAADEWMRQERLHDSRAGCTLQSGIDLCEEIREPALQVAPAAVEERRHKLCDDRHRDAEREHDDDQRDEDVNGLQHLMLLRQPMSARGT